MKKLLVLAAAVALLGFGANAQAAKVWDDMSWWGNTGATPEPQPDTHCGCAEPREGCYWWWPTTPASNNDDAELWGNRGIVFHCYVKEQVTTPPTPGPTPPATPTARTPVSAQVLFDFDKAVLKPEGKAAIDNVVADLKAHPGDTVVIEGHTDSSGSDAYNMALGQRRADAVKNYMIEMGIEPGRIQTQSFGESRPAVSNDTPQNRALNRRAVFVTTIKP